LVRLASPLGPIAAKTRDKGKSIKESSCEALSANVPGGEPRRKVEKGIRTAPDRNCSIATLAEKENVPPGCDKTSVARVLGSRERTSFNGNTSMSPVCCGIGPGAGAGGVDIGAGGGDRGAGAGAGARFSATGAAAGGGLNAFENSLLNASNMDFAAGHIGNYLSARR
jgi:hypothetical protein